MNSAAVETLGDERRHRVLVVDDSESNRTILVRWFQLRGFEAVEAESGVRALDLIEGGDFDVVLLDVMMPQMNGIEVLRRIREKRSLAALPVIMVTGKTETEDVVEALSADANDYITKPVDLEVAFARVQTQIRRKDAEAAIRRANDDLERQLHGSRRVSVEEQKAILADLSHEIRTPLNGVVSVATVLAGTELQPAQREMVSIIENSAATLERLLTDLLDQAKSDSGRLEIRTERFSLAEAVQSVSALWEVKAREKGLSFRLELAAEAGGEVHGDGVRLKQILNNLLSNAVKFTDAGAVTLIVAVDGERCRFTVQDTGIGFGPAAKARLFQRFEQADGSISARFGGTGLGLAISRELARLMGGELECSSREGDGAVFTLDLPLPPAARDDVAQPVSAQAASEQGRGAQATARTLRILLAEDHPVNRKVVELMLQGSGCDLISVENGAEAFEIFRRSNFDVVLMDVQMPVMDGLSAVRMIRDWEAEQGRSATPILVLTAHNLPEHVRASLAVGANGHLGKPINAAELLSTIEAWTRGPLTARSDEVAREASRNLH